MGLRIYGSPTSPFARMVAVTLREPGLADDVAIILVSGTPVDPGSIPLALNPLGKIPALERDDGPALYDGRVICRYLDDLGAGGLYPAPPRLWETLTLEATGHGIAEAALAMTYEARMRAEAARSAPWVEGQWAKIARALDALESRWMSHLAGPLDVGQIAVGCALGYVDFRHDGRGWRSGRPALSAWAAQFAARPAMAATAPA